MRNPSSELSAWASALMLVLMLFPSHGAAQTSGIGLNPARLEIEVNAGQEKTVAFEIESPPSDVTVRGRLLLSMTDWDLDEHGAIRYVDSGTLTDSASSWIVFSPAAVSISSGETHLVRVTIRVPSVTVPGLYRAGIFVQERPPAAPPRRGDPVIYVRFRYVFALYVIVPPVSRQGELVDVQMQTNGQGLDLVCEMRNNGSQLLRPLISWFLDDAESKEIASERYFEGTVVLPDHTMKQSFPILAGLPPGKYEIRAEVDFQDEGPRQSVRRTVTIGASQLLK